jgi:hypothetical protein
MASKKKAITKTISLEKAKAAARKARKRARNESSPGRKFLL